MAYYLDTTTDDLTKLREGLTIIERLFRSTSDTLPTLVLYGLCTDLNILDAAKEAIAAYGDEDVSEEEIELSEIAVELSLSSDVLYYLLGSGLKLDKGDEFAYQGEQGEGIREVTFKWARSKATVTVGSFTKMALATDRGWLDRFLTQYGTRTPIQIQKKVERTEPAVLPEPVQKQTSIPGARQLKDLMEDFLG